MFDAKRLLDSLVQAGMTQSTGQRVRNALGAGEGEGREGGLLGRLGGLLGGGQGGAGLSAVLGQALGGLQQSAGRAGEALKANDPVTVGGLGAIVGAVLGGRGGAVGGGALALLGSLAYAALQAAKAQQAEGQREAAAGEPAALEQLASEDTARLLLQAMIDAAKADGALDPAEIERILGKLEAVGADAEARAWVVERMRAPADLDRLVAAVPGPEVAAEVYAASLLAIEVDTAAERDYLAELARRLGLSEPVVAHIHRTLGVA